MVTLEDYDTNFSKEQKYGRPTGKESVYNLTTALVGAPPAQGDILRIAVRTERNGEGGNQSNERLQAGLDAEVMLARLFAIPKGYNR